MATANLAWEWIL